MIHTPLTIIADGETMPHIVNAAATAAKRFLEETGEEATHVWLHQSWGEDKDKAMLIFNTGLEPLFDPTKKERTHLSVGKAPVPEEDLPTSKRKERANVPTRDNTWVGFRVDDPGVGNIITAVSTAKESFIEQLKTFPTHVTLHPSFEKVRRTIEDETGLTLVFDPPMAYPTWGQVGLRDISEVKLEVKSSAGVKKIAYFPNGDTTGTLFITYEKQADKDGNPQDDTLYQYNEVPEDVYEELLVAPSKGAFINSKIKQYDTYKLK